MTRGGHFFAGVVEDREVSFPVEAVVEKLNHPLLFVSGWFAPGAVTDVIAPNETGGWLEG